MTERIVQHKHCPECGKAMSATKEFCSDECKQSREVKQRERKRTLYTFYALIALMIVLFFLQISGMF